MSNSSSGLSKFLDFLIEFLRALFSSSKPATGGTLEPQPPTVTVPADNTTEPARIVTPRVLLIVYDPVMDPASGQKLSEEMNWNKVDDLIAGFNANIEQASNGLVSYKIEQRINMNEFPALADGFRYDPTSYKAVIKKEKAPHEPAMVDYQAILTGFNILARIASREIDEVWVFAFPYAGFYESIMGGTGAFWCNAPPLPAADDCDRRFILMGYSFERGVGEMLESFGHRTEFLLAKKFDCLGFLFWAYDSQRSPAEIASFDSLNLFQRYILFDQIAPGQAAVGTIHYAPNSEIDYQWGNLQRVPSSCHDWGEYPAFENDIREVNADEWGGGDICAHHVWWLKHLPKVAGRSAGILNNWWTYTLDPNLA